MIIVGKLRENKDRIDRLSDCFGGTKIELAMTNLQLSLSKLRDKDSKQESSYSSKSTTIVIVSSKGRAQRISAESFKP